MKKVFCFFLFLAIFSSAFADPVAGEPSHANPATFAKDGNNNIIQPGYELANSDTANDSKMVTASYVKGAYNATIKAVNTVADSVPTSEPSNTASGRVALWVE